MMVAEVCQDQNLTPLVLAAYFDRMRQACRNENFAPKL